MNQGKKKEGENEVDAIVFQDYIIKYDDCNKICNKSCSLDSWRTEYGYLELNNTVKYSTCENPHDDSMYAKMSILIGKFRPN